MYCPNCKQNFPGKFCPECGTKLVEEPSNYGLNINLGDANAISGGINVTHTIVERSKSDKELALDASNQYLSLCREVYEDLVLTPDELAQLENKRLELGLEKVEADAILESVRQLAMRAKYTAPLSGISKMKLKQFSDAILANNEDSLLKLLDGIEILANKNANEELQFKCYLVLSALNPEKCIQVFETAETDNYWMSFWSYFAYLNTGRTSESEELLITLADKFSDYPEDNVTVLAAAGILIQEGVAAAQEYLDMITGMSSPLLQRFDEALAVVSGRIPNNSSNLEFYKQKVLKVWNDSDKEARIAAAEQRNAAEKLQMIIEEAKADDRFKFSDDGTVLIKCRDKNIMSYEVPICVKRIGSMAFTRCRLEQIVIPEGVEEIEEYAFSDCSKLKELTLPSTLRVIGIFAFRNSGLETIVIPEGVEEIETSAFSECSKLKELILPSTLRAIGDNAFSHSALETVVIPERIEEIGRYAFGFCSKLINVVFPSLQNFDRILVMFAFAETPFEKKRRNK